MNQTRRTIGGLALPALLLTLLLLLVGQAECRPSETETENESDIASLPPNVDNVELHRVKLVNGVMTEDHPVIMYKEDFVNEDYDPTKNQTKSHPHRQYKHLKRTRHHHSRTAVEKQQEKQLFDVLPETPLFVDDAVDDDSGADNFEAAQLLQPSKQETLQKFPKKYHSRQRRQAYYNYKNDYYVPQQQVHSLRFSGQYYLPVEPPRQYQRHPVEGKKPKYQGKLPSWQSKPKDPVNIGTRFDSDDNSLFHDSNPANADFSKFNQPRPQADPNSGASSNNWQQSAPTRSPVGGFQSPPQSVEEDRRPIWESRPVTSRPTTTARPATSAPTNGRRTTPRVSSCVWAIVNCCSQGNTDIHYHCFEEFGCHGAFWGVNPCADNVRDAPVFWSPPSSAPSYRQDILVYPEEPSYAVGSACHRASQLCCSLSNLASLYDCFEHLKCENSISEILSTCS